MGVDLDTFKRTTPYQPWNGSGPFHLFACGRLNPCKGHDDALRALALVRGRGIDAHLAIAGQDDTQDMRYRRTLDSLILELGLEGCVRLLGAVDEQIVRTEMERAHVFVLASLHEPLGVAIMEAMAMAVPLVVTREGGVPELVEDGTDGVLVDARAPDRIASALEGLAREPDRARLLGAHGLRTVAERFHSGVSARVIAECLGSLKEKP
jgi:glycosyltransferase involved in cell wall biosynthesis